jgi:two-component system sensor histidine kinase YesM
MFNWGQNTIRKEIESSATAQVHFLSDNFEYELKNISSQLERLINDSTLNQFSVNHPSLTTSEFYINLLEQHSLIKALPNNHAILDDIIIYYRNFDKALSAKKGYITIHEEAYEQHILNIKKNSFPLKENNADLFLGMMYPASSMYTKVEPRYLVAMYLSKEYISSYLSTFNNGYDTILLNHSTMTAIGNNQKKITKNYHQYLALINEELSKSSSSSISMETNNLFIIAEYSPYLNCSFIQLVPISEIFRLPRQYNWYLVLFSIACVFGVILYFVLAHRLVRRPVYMLLQSFHKIESGNFDVHLSLNHPTEEFESLINGFNKMAKRLNLTIDQLYKQEIYSQRMELKQLQMQINPHFLYNSYFILHRLIGQEDMENAKQLSAYLGNYFQYITRNSQDKVTLLREWEHATNYLEIQSIRYSIRLSISIDKLPSCYDNFYVPRLIIQPLLENAIEHGLKSKLEYGLVTLEYIDDTEFIHIRITDNGEQLTREDINSLQMKLNYNEDMKQETTALINIHRRLQLEFGETSGLTFSFNKPNGLIVDLRIEKTKSNFDIWDNDKTYIQNKDKENIT